MLESSLCCMSSIVSGKLERTAGMARPVFERYEPQAGEMSYLLQQRVNVAPVEMALLAQTQADQRGGMLADPARVAPLSGAGSAVEVTNYVIDNGGEQGDSLIALEGTRGASDPNRR
jgi:uncharacterized phosphosugar-binding protein